MTVSVVQTQKATVVKIKEDPEFLSANEKLISPTGLVYTSIDVNSISDPFYLITIDFIGSQLPHFKGLTPSKAESSTQKNVIFYRFEFTTNDGAKWQLIANIDTTTVIISLEKETQIGNATQSV